MSIQLSPATEAKIYKRFERGDYPDINSLMAEALRLLDERDARKELLHAMVQEGLDDIERGDVVEMTPTFWDEIWAEAGEEIRLGAPSPDYAKG